MSVPSEAHDLEMSSTGPSAHAGPQERGTYFTWHKVTVSIVVLVLNTWKFTAAMEGDNLMSSVLDFIITVWICGVGNYMLITVKAKRYEVLRWFFEDDCRCHVRAAFVWIFISLGLLNKRRVQDTRGGPLSWPSMQLTTYDTSCSDEVQRQSEPGETTRNNLAPFSLAEPAREIAPPISVEEDVCHGNMQDDDVMRQVSRPSLVSSATRNLQSSGPDTEGAVQRRNELESRMARSSGLEMPPYSGSGVVSLSANPGIGTEFRRRFPNRDPPLENVCIRPKYTHSPSSNRTEAKRSNSLGLLHTAETGELLAKLRPVKTEPPRGYVAAVQLEKPAIQITV